MAHAEPVHEATPEASVVDDAGHGEQAPEIGDAPVENGDGEGQNHAENQEIGESAEVVADELEPAAEEVDVDAAAGDQDGSADAEVDEEMMQEVEEAAAEAAPELVDENDIDADYDEEDD